MIACFGAAHHGVVQILASLGDLNPAKLQTILGCLLSASVLDLCHGRHLSTTEAFHLTRPTGFLSPGNFVFKAATAWPRVRGEESSIACAFLVFRSRIRVVVSDSASAEPCRRYHWVSSHKGWMRQFAIQRIFGPNTLVSCGVRIDVPVAQGQPIPCASTLGHMPSPSFCPERNPPTYLSPLANSAMALPAARHQVGALSWRHCSLSATASANLVGWQIALPTLLFF